MKSETALAEQTLRIFHFYVVFLAGPVRLYGGLLTLPTVFQTRVLAGRYQISFGVPEGLYQLSVAELN